MFLEGDTVKVVHIRSQGSGPRGGVRPFRFSSLHELLIAIANTDAGKNCNSNDGKKVRSVKLVRALMVVRQEAKSSKKIGVFPS